MTPAETHLLAWLRAHATRWDRALADALNTGAIESLEQTFHGWRVVARSKRGMEYRLIVVAHPITGDPMAYHRERPEDA